MSDNCSLHVQMGGIHPHDCSEEGMNTASAISDDRLQKQIQGKDITDISVFAHEENSYQTIAYEDTGAGIPDEEKEAIFEKWLGKNTGYDLFLVREILSSEYFHKRN